ncbi:MAG TPA: GGDEF domain-containing protein [Nitrosomonas sp.]|nr:GGDEF domain-containing protein [Nitrosomonas sp.]
MDNFVEQQFSSSNTAYSRLLYTQTIGMSAAGMIALLALFGWLVPSFDQILPKEWWLMKPDTALCILLGAISILLIQKSISVLAVRLCGMMIIFLAALSLYGYATGQSLPVEALLATDIYTEFPGRMPVHSAAFFCLLGLSFIVAEKIEDHRNNIRGFLTLLLISLVMVFFSGYFFSATSLYGHSTEILVDSYTFIAMCLLTYGNFVRGIHGGIFSSFMGFGISSYTARMTLPWALLGPFAIISAINYLSTVLGISLENRIALSATLLSLMLFFIIVGVSNKISHLEDDLRKLVLTDEMTGLYNNRAFCILGKHAFLDSLRNDSLIALLYFDLDGLKTINDTLGHQAGSEMIIEFANLLKANFRRNETIARIGGDEFVVLSQRNGIEVALKRLADATEAVNKKGKPYTISYSHGKITGRAKDYQSLDDLLEQADALMYKNKSAKKLGRQFT